MLCALRLLPGAGCNVTFLAVTRAALQSKINVTGAYYMAYCTARVTWHEFMQNAFLASLRSVWACWSTLVTMTNAGLWW